MPERGKPRSRRRRWAVRALVLAFYAGVAWMLGSIARGLEWADIGDALRTLPAADLALAAACSLTCYLLYAGYELLAAHHLGLTLRRRVIAVIGFVSYVFNLNLGAMLGAFGVRLRLYTARGVEAGDGVRVAAFNLLTNWLGYFATLGVVLLVLWSPVPTSWPLDGWPLRGIGVLLLALVVAYVWACARARRRRFTLRGQHIDLPTFRLAACQLALAVPVWLLGAASLALLLRAHVGFDLVLVTLMASAVAGLVVRIPAGLGVIEAMFFASLGPIVGEARLLAALLAYRCIHYLLPLLLGLAVFLVLEWRARGRRRQAGDAGHRTDARTTPVAT